MKLIAAAFSFVFFISCAYPKETNYTGSTPAGQMVRTFLGISLSDSIDFIRWKLSLTDLTYNLECTYGIGKPNTNGFYDPKTIKLSGMAKRDRATSSYTLENRNTTLKIAEINVNLLHILDKENNLSIGNGGWSYALNNKTPSVSNEVKKLAKQTAIKDSIAFEGRTPCGVPDIMADGQECYKLKWYLVLYNNNSYRILGTGYRLEGGKRGIWKINANNNGKIVYELRDENDKPFIHLLKLDDGILIFTDKQGNLLVGDHDFSYILNRRF